VDVLWPGYSRGEGPECCDSKLETGVRILKSEVLVAVGCATLLGVTQRTHRSVVPEHLLTPVHKLI